MRRAAIICFALLVASCVATQQLSESPGVLIEALVAEGDERAPRAFKHAIAAHEKLMDMGVKAFPELVKHANDRRYAWPCFQEQTLPDLPPRTPELARETVGRMCFRIIRAQVEARPPKYGRCWSGLGAEPLAEWWSRRSGRTLRELQIGAMHEAIAKVQGDQSVGEEGKRRLLEYWTGRLQFLEAGRRGKE